MLKKAIKYVDYNGEDQNEVFYFNISKAELIELNFSECGSLAEYLKKMIMTKDSQAMFAMFKKIVLGAVGEKSPDGKHFVKSEAITKAFEQSPAYDALLMELMSDTDKASDFINRIIPDFSGYDNVNVESLDKYRKQVNSQIDSIVSDVMGPE